MEVTVIKNSHKKEMDTFEKKNTSFKVNFYCKNMNLHVLQGIFLVITPTMASRENYGGIDAPLDSGSHVHISQGLQCSDRV
jgi:hypothetical protein